MSDGTNTDNAQSGSFPELQVTDGINYRLNLTVAHTAGVDPNTNLGNPRPALKIISGNKTSQSGTVTAYRNSFYGTFENKDAFDGTAIRSLAKSNKALVNGSTFNVNIPVGALRVVIAYPATLRVLTSVLDVNGLNAEIVSGFKLATMQVAGANGYSPIEYKVYTLDYAKPNDTANTYKVTI